MNSINRQLNICDIERSKKQMLQFPVVNDFHERRRRKRHSEFDGLVIMNKSVMCLLVDISEKGAACIVKNSQKISPDFSVDIILPYHELYLADISCEQISSVPFISGSTSNAESNRLSFHYTDIPPLNAALLCGCIDTVLSTPTPIKKTL